jgi:hypothetical protein
LGRHHAEPDEVGIGRQDPLHHFVYRQAFDVGIEHLNIYSVLAKDGSDVQDAERLKAIFGLVAWQQRRVAEGHLHEMFSLV